MSAAKSEGAVTHQRGGGDAALAPTEHFWGCAEA
jgi:hypothetical protein